MYKEEYYNLIENAKKKNKEKEVYYEIHHIIPRSLGGTDDETNLVHLTPEEHYEAHYLLWKFTNTPQMANAFWLMCNFKGVKISKEDYGELKRQAAQASAKRHSKPVYCLELDKFFSSCQEACLAVTGFKKNSQYIGQVCNKQIKAAFEWKDGLRYHWCWADEAEEYKKHKDELLYEEIHKKELVAKNISKAKKGILAPNRISVLCVELNKKFDNLKEAANFCNGNYDTLKNNAINGYLYQGYHWILEGYENVELKGKRPSNLKGKHLSKEAKNKLSKSMTLKAKIYCVELNKIFDSSIEAANYLKKSSGSYILESIRKNKVCYGYHWKLIPLEEAKKKIRCIELNKEFDTYKEAVSYISKTDSAYLRRSINDNHETCYGYHWELVGENDKKTIVAQERPKHGKKGTKIKCVETGQFFDSMSSAAKWLGISISATKYLKESIIKGTPYRDYHWELVK